MSEDSFREIREILEATASLTLQNRQDIAQLTQEVAKNTANLDGLTETFERLSQLLLQAESDRQSLQDEIREIRTDVAKIDQYLFGTEKKST